MILYINLDSLLLLGDRVDRARMEQGLATNFLWQVDSSFTFVDIQDAIVKFMILASDLDTFGQLVLAEIDGSVLPILFVKLNILSFLLISQIWMSTEGFHILSYLCQLSLVDIIVPTESRLNGN